MDDLSNFGISNIFLNEEAIDSGRLLPCRSLGRPCNISELVAYSTSHLQNCLVFKVLSENGKRKSMGFVFFSMNKSERT